MARRRRRKLGALGVILDEFPSISETFILREMLELENRGFTIVPLALRRPDDGPRHAEAEDLAACAIYRPPPLTVRSLLSGLTAMARFPAGFGSALLAALRYALRSPSAARELVVALITAGGFAARTRGLGISHIHAQFCSLPAGVGLLLAEILGVTFSISAHARDIFTNESALLSEKLAEAEFVAVCTDHGLERLRLRHPLAAGDNLHLIHHGIDPSRFMLAPEPETSPAVVLTVGRLIEKKGFDILLRAAAIARSHGAEFELHIVGDGPERDDLERLAAGLGLADITTFHGRLTQDDLMPLYRKAQVFALASIVTQDGDRDGIPNVLIEALAFGIPTVATTTGGIPELIIHEETGLLARPGDPAELAEALERIIYDEELRSHVRKSGREKVILEFDSGRNIERLVALLGKYAKRAADPEL